MTKPIAPIVTVTPQQAMGKALARGVIVDSGIKLLKIFKQKIHLSWWILKGTISENYLVLSMIIFTAFITESASISYFFISSAGVPDSPKVS